MHSFDSLTVRTSPLRTDESKQFAVGRLVIAGESVVSSDIEKVQNC